MPLLLLSTGAYCKDKGVEKKDIIYQDNINRFWIDPDFGKCKT